MYWQCGQCKGRVLDQEAYLSRTQEYEHYAKHENDIHDPAYRDFVAPCTSFVKAHIPKDRKGLDYGAGPGPVISAVLQEAGYSMVEYDPFFNPNDQVLEDSYDFVVCSEVAEHFHDVRGEFERLCQRVLPASEVEDGRGYLLLMTRLWSQEIDFEHWHYRRDPTHVFIYHRDTMQWIAHWLDLELVSCESQFTVLRRWKD
ncbi:MAG: class I SAM-dependent methyltransferase [Bacteroidetes bacterium]|nr:class I SAM-dependent methyltransferase [Bacteroidota bacterium]